MSFGGFVIRRVVKGVVNGIIDNIADSKEDAKSMKEGARWLITGIGVTASILTADPVGLGDAIVDHGADIAIDHGTDLVIDHGTDMAIDHGTDLAVDHGASYYDPTDHVSNYNYGTYQDNTPSYSGNQDIKFGGGGACTHYACGCLVGVYATGGSICLTCHHSYDDHW